MLTDALTDFPGTIVFISHDPTFLNRVATLIVEIDDGQARNYIGRLRILTLEEAHRNSNRLKAIRMM